MATYCIICGERKDGIEIKNDRVLEAIRWFKRNITRNEKGNKLVVCRADYETYKKKREKYTSRQALYVGIGVVFLILGLIISFSAQAVIMAIIVLLALYLMSLLNYTPALNLKPQKQPSAQAKHKQ